MNNRVINYKFYLLMALGILDFMLSIPMACLTEGSVRMIGIILIILGISYCTIMLLFEPLYYIIDKSGILICLAFSKKHHMWGEIAFLEDEYDRRFNLLFIEDYIIHKRKNFKESRRYERIVKCKKSAALIKKYSSKLS